jgi:hypothetical protein
MSWSGKLEREESCGDDAGERVARSARVATDEAVMVGAVHLKGLPMVKETEEYAKGRLERSDERSSAARMMYWRTRGSYIRVRESTSRIMREGR